MSENRHLDVHCLFSGIFHPFNPAPGRLILWAEGWMVCPPASTFAETTQSGQFPQNPPAWQQQVIQVPHFYKRWVLSEKYESAADTCAGQLAMELLARHEYPCTDSGAYEDIPDLIHLFVTSKKQFETENATTESGIQEQPIRYYLGQLSARRTQAYLQI